jgi:dipeptidyl aminopeptidase/acylaminoacyl peptidase
MNREVEVKPCGEWRSPVSIDVVTSPVGRVVDLLVDGDDVGTCELRPAENGRTTIVHRESGREFLPVPFSAGSSVNEYGGSCSVLVDDAVYFSNFADRRLYRSSLQDAPEAITPVSNDCYGDIIVDRSRRRLICVREDRDGATEPGNSLVAVDMDGNLEVSTLFRGPDFVASPALSDCGSRLAWISWDHPHMPFDESHLWIADVDTGGSLVKPRRLVANAGEYVSQPRWAPDGSLYFLSDRSGWTNIYRIGEDDEVIQVCPLDAEFGEMLWVLGEKSYEFVAPEIIVATYYQRGVAKLGRLHTGTGVLEELSSEFASIDKVVADNGHAWILGAKVDAPTDLYHIDGETGEITNHTLSEGTAIEPDIVSRPQLVVFEGAFGLPTYAFYYAPTNPAYRAPGDELPPLLVTAHGGPTYRHSAALMLGVQFWTSRGFAYLDVNYGGSTGFGREYRERLRGQWGLTDVEDCVRGARYAQERFGLDPERTAIRGASAGGFTTFAALAFTDCFRAGCSWFGISDLGAFDDETHRFESHYVDSLLGTGEDFEKACRERSPLQHVDKIDAPLAIFQGADDRVVPSNQSEQIADKLRARGISVVYRCYEGEGHGFKRKDTLADVYQCELALYASVFGFQPAAD